MRPSFLEMTVFVILTTLSLSCGGGFTFEFSSSNIELPCLTSCGPKDPPKQEALSAEGFALNKGYPYYLSTTPTLTWSPPKGGLPPYVYTLVISERVDCSAQLNQVNTGLTALEFKLKPLTFEGTYFACLSAVDGEKNSVSALVFTFNFVEPKQIKFSKEFLTATPSNSISLEGFKVSILDRNAAPIVGNSGSKIILNLSGGATEGLELSGNEIFLMDGFSYFNLFKIESSATIALPLTLTATLEGIGNLSSSINILQN